MRISASSLLPVAEGGATSKTSIRGARPGDLGAMVELLHLLFSIEADFNFDADRQRRGLQMMLDRDDAVILVAENKNRVIGMCTGQLTISTAEGGPALLVEDVVVAEVWQGLGVGRQLMSALVHWAMDRKLRRLQLLADRNNAAALEFYKTLGWQPTELICLRKRM